MYTTNTPTPVITVTLTPERTFVIEGKSFGKKTLPLSAMVTAFGRLIPRTGPAIVYVNDARVEFKPEAAEEIRTQKGIQYEHYHSTHRDEERISSHDIKTTSFVTQKRAKIYVNTR